MKRILSFLLVFVLLATLALTSCGGRTKVDLTGVKSIAALNGTGAYLAAQSDTYHIDALRAQVTGVNVSEYETFSLLLTALNSGAIDGYVAEEPTAWAVMESNDNLTYLPFVNNDTGFGATAADVGVAVAFKTGSESVAGVNRILSGISGETREGLMRQMVTFSAKPDEVVVGATRYLIDTEAEAAVANDAPVLKIAMECDYQPYNWTQTTDTNYAVKIANSEGYANGYDVRIARYVAAQLGMKLEVYALDWESLIPAVQSGTVDGIIAGMSPTAEREEEVDFTECYWTSNLVIITTKAAA